MLQKIKSFIESDLAKDLMIVLIVILVGLVSFELGRLSKGGSEGLKIEYMGQDGRVEQANVLQALSAPATQNSTGKAFFASSRGSKYYSIGCSAGKDIKQENRIYFATAADAEQAGYTLSASCS
ncbi:MAG TPA: hypothetical protein VJB95_00925 [Candidatus Paceibacterota bacterium]